MRSRPRQPAVARFAVVAVILAAALAAVLAVPGPAGAVPGQEEGTTTTSEAPDAPDIIPRPNSGSEPDDAGDRGGSLQTVLFVVVMAGIVVIGALIVRESRKARERRGF